MMLRDMREDGRVGREGVMREEGGRLWCSRALTSASTSVASDILSMRQCPMHSLMLALDESA